MFRLLFRTLQNETSAILCVLEALNSLKDQSLRDVTQRTLVAKLLHASLCWSVLLQSVTIRAVRYGFLRFTFKQPTNSFSLLTAPSFLLYWLKNNDHPLILPAPIIHWIWHTQERPSGVTTIAPQLYFLRNNFAYRILYEEWHIPCNFILSIERLTYLLTYLLASILSLSGSNGMSNWQDGWDGRRNRM